MAGVARATGEWRVGKLLHQLRLCRLVRIVTLNAICGGEWLPLVRLDQAGIFHIVAVDAQRGVVLVRWYSNSILPGSPDL